LLVCDEWPVYKEYENAVLIPEYGCLYDEHGEKIKGSCYYYGDPPAIKNNAPDRIDAAKYVKHQEPVAYTGKLSKHYGHFLIESISRLWFYFRHSHIRHVCFNKNIDLNRHVFRKRFLKKLSMLDNMGFFSRNTMFKKIIVPEPSFVNKYKAHSCHALAPETVAANQDFRFKGRLAYLSRRKLPDEKGKIKGERTIEKMVKKNGGDVYYPERLSFEKQIEIVNSYRIIAGCKGSALHTLLFKVSDIPLKVVLFCSEQEEFKNHEAINRIKNIACDYVTGSLTDDPGCRKKGSNQNQIINLDRVREEFQKLQLDPGP